MSSITAQQNKLDLELVPKDKRLEIGKCNGRLTRGMKPREPTFQVALDALALTPCYYAFLITADVLEVYMHQFWNFVYKHDTFYRFKLDKKRFKLTLKIFRDIFKICLRVQGQDFDTLHTNEEIVSFLRELGHTREINSLNDVVVDQMHQPWQTFAALISKSLSGKTTAVPPKIARKFKKAFSTKKDINQNLVHVDEEPVKKAKRVKRPTKKSTTTPTAGIVIRDAPMETKSKMKEKVDITRGKGIKLLSEVALTKDAQFKEHETKENESASESDQQENEKEAEDDEEEKEEEFVHTPSNTDDEDDTNVESKTKNKAEGVEDEEMDYTTSLLYEDMDVRRNDLVYTDEGFAQQEGTKMKMINAQQGNANLEITHDQVIEDANVTISNVPKETEVPATSSSRSSDLASKFLNFSDIYPTYAEIVSPMDVPVHHESYDLDKSLFSTYDNVYSLKRIREDKDKDEGPSA
ncbi:hypothetical protein Tco_0730033 [Tanacetum coccineum]|uniref:Uncharacterized protein n=1 Tax=Tanacetum coccineum TaxID=301880 RepID=A0ABQ4YTC4_9ASTR